jgi:hypothetical protein
MCDSLGSCDECPVRESFTAIDCPIVYRGVDMTDIEQPVMDWAEKHPEPRYPSWHDAWKQLFPDGQGSPCPTSYGMKYEPEWCGRDECYKCRNRPIPADIAEKLGIKPIGEANDG